MGKKNKSKRIKVKRKPASSKYQPNQRTSEGKTSIGCSNEEAGNFKTHEQLDAELDKPSEQVDDLVNQEHFCERNSSNRIPFSVKTFNMDSSEAASHKAASDGNKTAAARSVSDEDSPLKSKENQSPLTPKAAIDTQVTAADNSKNSAAADIVGLSDTHSSQATEPSLLVQDNASNTSYSPTTNSYKSAHDSVDDDDVHQVSTTDSDISALDESSTASTPQASHHLSRMNTLHTSTPSAQPEHAGISATENLTAAEDSVTTIAADKGDTNVEAVQNTNNDMESEPVIGEKAVSTSTVTESEQPVSTELVQTSAAKSGQEHENQSSVSNVESIDNAVDNSKDSYKNGDGTKDSTDITSDKEINASTDGTVAESCDNLVTDKVKTLTADKDNAPTNNASNKCTDEGEAKPINKQVDSSQDKTMDLVPKEPETVQLNQQEMSKHENEAVEELDKTLESAAAESNTPRATNNDSEANTNVDNAELASDNKQDNTVNSNSSTPADQLIEATTTTSTSTGAATAVEAVSTTLTAQQKIAKSKAASPIGADTPGSFCCCTIL